MVLDQSKWKYVVTAMDGSVPPGAGEIPKPNNRTYSDPLNGVRTAGCSITSRNPKSSFVLNNDCMLKLYRMDRNGAWHLLLNGDIISAEEQGTGNQVTIDIVASDPFIRLNKRLIGMQMSGNQGTGFTIGAPSLPMDLSLAISQVLSAVNSDFYSGIGIGTVANCATTGVAGPLWAVFAGPTIQQICATLGGPDFWIQPLESTGVMPNTTIGQLNVGPARGIPRPNTIFEYGMGRKTVAQYTRLLTKQGSCNHAAALPNGWPTSIATGDTIAYADDATSQNTITRYDDIVSTDVSDLGLRTALCNENVTVRKQRQQQITVTPAPGCPLDYTVDFDTGDVVKARAYDADTNTVRFNGSIRLYGVALTMNDQEEESATLTLITDTVSGGLTYNGALG